MDKNTEIGLLEKLGNADSYFGNEFSEETVNQMCQNVRNDHPILLNTDYEKAINAFRNQRIAKREREETPIKLIMTCHSPDGFRYLKFSIFDEYGEFMFTGFCQENTEGTDLEFSFEFPRLSLSLYSDRLDFYASVSQRMSMKQIELYEICRDALVNPFTGIKQFSL